MSNLSWLSQQRIAQADDAEQERRRRRAALMGAMSAYQDQPEAANPADMTPAQRRTIEGEAGSRRQAVNLFFGRPDGVNQEVGDIPSSMAARMVVKTPGGYPLTSDTGSKFFMEKTPTGADRLYIQGKNAPKSSTLESWESVQPKDGQPGRITAVGKPQTQEEKDRDIEHAGMLSQVEELRRKDLHLPPGEEGNPDVKATHGRYEDLVRTKARAEIKQQIIDAGGTPEQAERVAREWDASVQDRPPTAGDVARQMGDLAAQEEEQRTIARQTPMLGLAKKQLDVDKARQAVEGTRPQDILNRDKYETQKDQFNRRMVIAQHGLTLREKAWREAGIQKDEDQAIIREKIQNTATYQQAVLEERREREDYARRADPSIAQSIAATRALEAMMQAISSGDEQAMVNAENALPPELRDRQWRDEAEIKSTIEMYQRNLDAKIAEIELRNLPEMMDRRKAIELFIILGGDPQDTAGFEQWYKSLR